MWHPLPARQLHHQDLRTDFHSTAQLHGRVTGQTFTALFVGFFCLRPHCWCNFGKGETILMILVDWASSPWHLRPTLCRRWQSCLSTPSPCPPSRLMILQLTTRPWRSWLPTTATPWSCWRWAAVLTSPQQVTERLLLSCFYLLVHRGPEIRLERVNHMEHGERPWPSFIQETDSA